MAVQSFYKKIPDPENGASRHTGSSADEQEPDSESIAVSLNHDLSMLRIIETFAESAPQLTLMLTIFLQQGHPDLITGAILNGHVFFISVCFFFFFVSSSFFCL